MDFSADVKKKEAKIWERTDEEEEVRATGQKRRKKEREEEEENRERPQRGRRERGKKSNKGGNDQEEKEETKTRVSLASENKTEREVQGKTREDCGAKSATGRRLPREREREESEDNQNADQKKEERKKRVREENRERDGPNTMPPDPHYEGKCTGTLPKRRRRVKRVSSQGKEEKVKKASDSADF